MRSSFTTRWNRLGTLGLIFLIATGAEAPAQEAKTAAEKAERTKKAAIALEEEVTRALDAIDLTPRSDPDIPDPPPREGAMIDMPPYRIEAPDLILVEVLDALEGRPISGERLVRPDGTIFLSFYGSVHVQGLTVEQARVKIIRHLRTYLTDEILGLTEPKSTPPPPAPAAVPQPVGAAIELEPQAHARPSGLIPGAGRLQKIPGRSMDLATKRWLGQGGGPGRVYFARATTSPPPPEPPAQEPAAPAQEPPKATEFTTSSGVTIHIQIEEQNKTASTPTPNVVEEEESWELKLSPLLGGDRVFVDVTAYNSKNYFVLGDVGAPGKLPITGHETVLDALQYAGGVIGPRDDAEIRLVRPERNGKPARTYPVDLAGIIDRGETKTNYQIFPGDRLVVTRKRPTETPARSEPASEGRPATN